MAHSPKSPMNEPFYCVLYHDARNGGYTDFCNSDGDTILTTDRTLAANHAKRMRVLNPNPDAQYILMKLVPEYD